MFLKKISVCILTVAIFAAIDPACAPCANLTLNTTSSDVSAGEQFTISIHLDESDGVAGAAFTLVYPADAFELVKDSPVATDFFNIFYDTRSDAPVESVDPWEQNSETSGEIQLSGAYIGTDSETGGGGCRIGEQVLFNVTFQAKQGSVAGDYEIELEQTPLFGAGWGVDNDNDGVYDEQDGDEYELSPVLLKAYSKGTEQWESEGLEDDFEVILDSFDTAPSVSIRVASATDGQAGSIYFPHAASGEVWETEIAVINSNPDVAITGDLAAYDQDGAAAGTIRGIELAPFARRQVVAGECDSFPAPESVSYLVFTSETGGAKGYTKFYIEGKFRAALPAVTEINQGTVNVPHIASTDTWSTGLAFVNTLSEDKTLVVEFDSGDVKNVEVAAGQHKAVTVRSLFDGASQPEIGSAQVKNAAGVIGLELFGTTTQLSGVILTDDTADVLVYPHIATTGGWNTGVVAYNPSDEACELTITAYDAEGTQVNRFEETLASRAKFVGQPAGLGFSELAKWIKVEGSEPLAGFELFSSSDQDLLAGYTGVNIQRASGILPKIEKDGSTGVALVNSSGTQTVVTLTAYDDSGSVVAQTAFTLAADEKKVDTAEDFFEGVDISDATYVAFDSEQQITAFQLNMSSDQMMLDALEGM